MGSWSRNCSRPQWQPYALTWEFGKMFNVHPHAEIIYVSLQPVKCNQWIPCFIKFVAPWGMPLVEFPYVSFLHLPLPVVSTYRWRDHWGIALEANMPDPQLWALLLFPLTTLCSHCSSQEGVFLLFPQVLLGPLVGPLSATSLLPGRTFEFLPGHRSGKGSVYCMDGVSSHTSAVVELQWLCVSSESLALLYWSMQEPSSSFLFFLDWRWFSKSNSIAWS